MAEIPKFDLPLRYSKGKASVNEQGSVEDIAACVTAVCLCRPDDLMDNPDFGVPDPTFKQSVNAQDFLPFIERWEPAASVLAQVSASKLDEAVINAEIEVSQHD